MDKFYPPKEVCQYLESSQFYLASMKKDSKLQHFPGHKAVASTIENNDGHSVLGGGATPRQKVISELLVAHKYIE